MKDENHLPRPRVVVTGHVNGQSTIVQDSLATNAKEFLPNFVLSDIWATDSMPADLNQIFQIETTPFWPNTPKNGTYFRFVQIPPDSQILEKAIELKKGSKEFKHNPSDPHPLFMHKTDTLDYIIILSGELYLITEEKETLLKAGDIVIQRGTNHAWSNRSDQVCIQLAILIDAKK